MKNELRSAIGAYVKGYVAGLISVFQELGIPHKKPVRQIRDE